MDEMGRSVLHPEHPGDPALSTYDLWFPFNPEELDNTVHLHVDWPSVLDDGSTTERMKPTPETGLTDVTAITAR